MAEQVEAAAVRDVPFRDVEWRLIAHRYYLQEPEPLGWLAALNALHRARPESNPIDLCNLLGRLDNARAKYGRPAPPRE